MWDRMLSRFEVDGHSDCPIAALLCHAAAMRLSRSPELYGITLISAKMSEDPMGA